MEYKFRRGAAFYLRAVLVLALILFSSPLVSAQDFTSPGFILRDPVVTVEGGRSTSPSFEYFSATGQTITGENTSAGFIHRAGFLYFSAEAPPPPPPPPPPAPSGGGGGGGAIGATITFSGKAYPLSRVSVLKDGQVAITTIAGPDANFEASLTGLTSGNYMFSVLGEDTKGRRSTLFTFPMFLTTGAGARVSGIFITPTIALDKTEVRRGDNVAIFGSSPPRAQITIGVSSTEEVFVKTTADSSGGYLYNLDTSLLEFGHHFSRSKATLGPEISPFGRTLIFAVGTKTVLAEPSGIPSKGDINNDQRINLIDFSIVAYWYQRPSPPTHIDLNGDGRIDLRDFSIMAYYWTG